MSDEHRRGWTVREATADDELGVRRVLDAAVLETDAVSDAIERGDVLVAVAGSAVAAGDETADDEATATRDATADATSAGDANVAEDATAGAGRVLGACVLVPPEAVATHEQSDPASGMHVDAIAVRRRRRAEGIGTALVEAALDRAGRLTAAFDPAVRPFYESLGFDIEARDGRLWGVTGEEE